MAYIPRPHANLSALGGDDHPQYHISSRADARYPSRTGARATPGTGWTINITGSAGSATSADDAGSTGNVDWVWCQQRGGPGHGFHMHWADWGIKEWIWQSDDNANNYVVNQSTFSRSDHNHNDRYGSKWWYNHVDVGTMNANTAYGPWVWGHGLGMGPRTVIPTATYDDNTHSCVAAIGNLWDGVNVAIVGRNVGSGNEAVAMGFIAWG